MKFRITRQDFEADIARRMVENDCFFINAVYMALDKCVKKCRQDSGIQFACSEGCSACCFQLVTCTRLEFEAILRYIQSLPNVQQRAILRGAKNTISAWARYFRENEQSLASASPTRVYEDWFGKACPFLSQGDGVCRIYPVRPIDCRTFISTEKCPKRPLTGIECEGVERMRFDPERWANNFILEEEKRLNGRMATTPLHHWIFVSRIDEKND